MANTRGKSLSQERERRLVESLRAARLRLFDTPTADILRRLFGERRLVNGTKPFTCSNSQYFGYRSRAMCFSIFHAELERSLTSGCRYDSSKSVAGPADSLSDSRQARISGNDASTRVM